MTSNYIQMHAKFVLNGTSLIDIDYLLIPVSVQKTHPEVVIASCKLSAACICVHCIALVSDFALNNCRRLNRLGDEGCSAICAALSGNTILERLSLSANEAGPQVRNSSQ